MGPQHFDAAPRNRVDRQKTNHLRIDYSHSDSTSPSGVVWK
jgi:hypothetical protein